MDSIDIIPGFLLCSLSMLYIVDAVIFDFFANVLIAIPRSLQSSSIRNLTAIFEFKIFHHFTKLQEDNKSHYPSYCIIEF